MDEDDKSALEKRFDLNKADYFDDFNMTENKRSKRRDLQVLLLIDELIPDGRLIIGAAAHDQIWIDVDVDEFEKIVTNGK